jgi:hypothetical protein
MLRHDCGYKLANDGYDTRSLAHYLGHRNLQSTARYTALAPDRFAKFWQDQTIVWAGFKEPTHSHLKDTERYSPSEGRVSAVVRERKAMRDEIEINFNFESVLEPQYRRTFIWRDAVRHRHAVMMLARQTALMEVGQQATAIEFAAYFKQHQARLVVEAENIIQTRRGFARWRFPRHR